MFEPPAWLVRAGVSSWTRCDCGCGAFMLKFVDEPVDQTEEEQEKVR